MRAGTEERAVARAASVASVVATVEGVTAVAMAVATVVGVKVMGLAEVRAEVRVAATAD